MLSSAYKMIYQDALTDLMNGCLMPWDKEILSGSPLPSTMIEPYMAKEVPDVRESMRLTYETMAVWIDEAKKVNYFSRHFVQLSRMIMNGVTTMGRGLITLHARGETLDDVPMSIQDLIGVASYHFRKSHLGVLQTVRSHPEISEHLLMNQIAWNNMLMRLFKTKEKLEQVPAISCRKAEAAAIPAPENEEGRKPASGLMSSGSEKALTAADREALPASAERDLMLSGAKDEGFDPFRVFGPADRGISEPAAIREPGKLTAPRAFSSYDSQQVSRTGSQVPAGTGQRRKEPAQSGTEKNLPENEKTVSPVAADNADGISQKKSEIRNSANEDGRRKDEANGQTQEAEITEERQDKEDKPETTEEIQNRENDRNTDDGETRTEVDQNGTNNQTKINSPSEPKAGQSCERDLGSCDVGSSSPEEPCGTIFQTQPPHRPPESDLPPYLQILQNAFARSGPSEDDVVNFTFDEILYLAADPDFNFVYPDQAAQMRSILQNLDSG